MTDLHLGAHEGTRAEFVDDHLDDAAAGPSNPLDDLRSGIRAFVNIGVDIGNKVDAQRKATDRLLARLERNTPVNYSAIASGVYPATGVLVLNLGTADQGTFWEVESCAVGGTDANVTAAGTAGLYVCGFVPTATTLPGMTSLADYATSLPNPAFYGGRDIVVNDQEYLSLVIFGGTPGQTYVANAQVSVFNVASGRGDVDVVS